MLKRCEIDPPDLDECIEFQIVDWFAPEASTLDYSKEYDIEVYGVTADGHTVRCLIEGFDPFFYVKCPPNKTKGQLNAIIADLEYRLENGQYHYAIWRDGKRLFRDAIPAGLRSHYKGMKVIKKYDFWGFQDGKTSNFIRVSVTSLKLFRVLRDVFASMPGYSLYESNIEPFIRYIHKQNIYPCGWVSVRVEDMTADLDDGTAHYKFSVNHADVRPIPKNTIAPLLIASFDIECTSSHGDFPLARKDYRKVAQQLMKCPNIKSEIETCLRTIIYGKDYIIDENYKVQGIFFKDHISSQTLDSSINKVVGGIQKWGTDTTEDELTDFLNKNMPMLEGDSIIQIGTTFNVFGSDKIIHKNIITLKECAAIDDCEVICCRTERDLLMQWKNLIKETDPDILTGYNILGFDFKYIYDRTKELRIDDDFQTDLGRSSSRNVPFINKSISSSAMGEVITTFYDIEGMLIIDVFTFIKRDMNLESYKLDFVASHILKERKNDLKPSEIFAKYFGGAEDIRTIAEYCIQDCCLVNKIIHKRKIIENNFGMANVCLVPVSYIFHRGQGIKIYSLVLNECAKRKQVIPTLQRDMDEDEEGYVGAIVLEPKTGIYIEDPIVVFDYSSLYPSSMIAENLSHDSLILDEERYIRPDGTLNSDNPNLSLNKIEMPDGSHHYFVQDSTAKYTIPQILQKLIKQRKITRSKIEYEKVTTKDGNIYTGLVKEKDGILKIIDMEQDITNSIAVHDVDKREDAFTDFEKAVFDSLQLAYKITANSLYGQTGARTSQIYMKPIAQSTTSTGRNMILMAKDFVEQKYNADVIYGDSVMPYTPITINDNNVIRVTTFEKLEGDWIAYNQFKPKDTDRFNKEQFVPRDLKVWTHKGWATIRRIIRHKTTKKIYRVTTTTGLVDITEDHSLLDMDVNIIKPNDCTVGQSLLHSRPDLQNTYYDNFNSDSDIFVDQESAQRHCLTLQLRGYDVVISSSANMYKLAHDRSIKEQNKIQKIEVLYDAYEGYVYDIETEYGVFHGGIGNMILKNTDSIFCKFELKDDNGVVVKGKEAIPYAIRLGQKIEKHIAEEILHRYKPQALNYEKVLSPLILFSKKRYTGLLYETDPNKCYQKSMGIVLKRRDNAHIVKDVYGAVIDRILKDNDLQGSFKELDERLTRIANGQVDIDSLILSKTLKSTYATPEKIPHKALADRIAARDPGNKPAINDRIPFVYIRNDDPYALQGDRVEHPEYLKEHKDIQPDYLFYITNQIMNPVVQLYTLCMEEIPGYDCDEGYWKRVEDELRSSRDLYKDDEKRAKRIQDLKERMVVKLLFDKYINSLGGIVKRKTRKKDQQEIEMEIENVVHVDKNTNYNLKVKEVRKDNIITVDIKRENETIGKETYSKMKDNKDTALITEIIKIADNHPGERVTFKIEGNSLFVNRYQDLVSNTHVDNNHVYMYDVMRNAIAAIEYRALGRLVRRITILK